MFDKSYIKPYVFGDWGHFSQVVWATSWRVGCGRAMFMEDGWYTTFLVCNYGPTGNMEDGEMYKKQEHRAQLVLQAPVADLHVNDTESGPTT
ncbi:u6-Nephitoxin-Nsp1b_2 [Caerostris extrusa]|uniref:U6-Nephitoxin-Nsp1b_2 n=1 Tax=Caerostris extrusa TaxID=172846 RepID=A0AAV4PTS1_CAEEX|nr:u6-Nephitoxin-Nsp1b_2 [Caerostris extrusa]